MFANLCWKTAFIMLGEDQWAQEFLDLLSATLSGRLTLSKFSCLPHILQMRKVTDSQRPLPHQPSDSMLQEIHEKYEQTDFATALPIFMEELEYLDDRYWDFWRNQYGKGRLMEAILAGRVRYSDFKGFDLILSFQSLGGDYNFVTSYVPFALEDTRQKRLPSPDDLMDFYRGYMADNLDRSFDPILEAIMPENELPPEDAVDVDLDETIDNVTGSWERALSQLSLKSSSLNFVEGLLQSFTKDFSQLVEKKLDDLPFGYFKLEASSHMKVGVRERVTAQIAQEIEYLEKAFGDATQKSIKISPKMKVVLRGDSFKITSLNSEEQVVLDGKRTKWSWEVTPEKAGERTLKLTVVAVIVLKGYTDSRYDYPIEEVTVQVAVNPAKSIMDFLKKYWHWLVGLLLGSGLLWKIIDYFAGIGGY